LHKLSQLNDVNLISNTNYFFTRPYFNSKISQMLQNYIRQIRKMDERNLIDFYIISIHVYYFYYYYHMRS